MDWNKAILYLDNVIGQYKELIGMPRCNPYFGLMYLASLKERVEKGERTEELYEEIMECK